MQQTNQTSTTPFYQATLETVTMADLSDEELMQRIQQGDAQAFQRLVEQYIQPLYRFTYRALGNPCDAEDAVQDTFLKVWRRAYQWHASKASLSTWLHTIAHNVCIDQYRQRKINTEPLDAANNVPSVTDSILQADMATDMAKLLQTLPARQRHALLLCYYQGLSNQEAAQILNVNVSALESLLARARRTLRHNNATHHD